MNFTYVFDSTKSYSRLKIKVKKISISKDSISKGYVKCHVTTELLLTLRGQGGSF